MSILHQPIREVFDQTKERTAFSRCRSVEHIRVWLLFTHVSHYKCLFECMLCICRAGQQVATTPNTLRTRDLCGSFVVCDCIHGSRLVKYTMVEVELSVWCVDLEFT